MRRGTALYIFLGQLHACGAPNSEGSQHKFQRKLRVPVRIRHFCQWRWCLRISYYTSRWSLVVRPKLNNGKFSNRPFSPTLASVVIQDIIKGNMADLYHDRQSSYKKMFQYNGKNRPLEVTAETGQHVYLHPFQIPVMPSSPKETEVSIPRNVKRIYIDWGNFSNQGNPERPSRKSQSSMRKHFLFNLLVTRATTTRCIRQRGYPTLI